ncbi:MAG: hypothetical protein V4812_15835 [Pseudomonadota bacterium]
MTHWIIAFSKDNNTLTLTTEAAEKPSLDRAVELVRVYAEREFEPLEPSEQDEGLEGPAQELLQRFGITLTGIAEAE